MKNIISSCFVFCLLLVSQVGFAQGRVVKQVHIDSAKKDITEIKKYIELTPVEEEEVYKILLDKNEYLNEYPEISPIRRNGDVAGYLERIEYVFEETSDKIKFDALEKNQILLKKIDLNVTPETNN